MYNGLKWKVKDSYIHLMLNRDIGKGLNMTIDVYKYDSNTISRALLPTGLHNLKRVACLPMEPFSFMFTKEVPLFFIEYHDGGHCASLVTR